jgi:dTMP kinase
VPYDISKMSRLGRFIVIEGGEGSGKTRLQAALADAIRKRPLEVVAVREPGGTPLGERVRALVAGEGGLDDPLAELLLFEAARAHLVATVIAPALEHRALVLCDRFAASSVAYQGFGRGLGRDVVERANAIATGGLTPDLTLLLDLPAAVGIERRTAAGEVDHFDKESMAFHERVRAGYLELAGEDPVGWRVIDATMPFDAVLAAARDAVAGSLRALLREDVP